MIRSSIEEGEAILERPGAIVYRLTWKAADTDRRRFLPAGSYKVRGYRMFRTDHGGDLWHLSVSSPGFDVAVSEAHPLDLRIDPVVQVGTALRRQKGPDRPWVVSAIMHGARKQGMSVYRNGKRIPLGFRLYNGGGKTVRTGSLEYG